jgi:hypothetical protein
MGKGETTLTLALSHQGRGDLKKRDDAVKEANEFIKH